MTPEQIEANLARFNEASQAAESALEGLKAYLEANTIPDDFSRLLEAFIASTSVMVETSSDLIGITGPLAPSRPA